MRFRPMLLTAAAVVVGSFVILFDPIFQGLAISLMMGEVAATLLSRHGRARRLLPDRPPRPRRRAAAPGALSRSPTVYEPLAAAAASITEEENMTVERALRGLAGFFVVLAWRLGYWVHPAWFLFTAFVGAEPVPVRLHRHLPRDGGLPQARPAMKAIILITDPEAMREFVRVLVAEGHHGFTVMPAVAGSGRHGLKTGDRVHPAIRT